MLALEGLKGWVDVESRYLMKAADYKAAERRRLLNDKGCQLTKTAEQQRLLNNEGCQLMKAAE